MRDMLRRGRNFEVVQVEAAEYIAGIGRGRLHLDLYRGVVMKPCSTCAEIGANRRLFAQAGDPFQNCADGSSPRPVVNGALLMKRRSLPLAALIRATRQSVSHFSGRA